MPTTQSSSRTSTSAPRKRPASGSRKAPAKGPARRPAGNVRAHRSPAALPRLPHLERHQLDLLGLALVALGVFLGFLLWAGWDGGAAGRAISDGLAYLVGELRYLAPVALVATGAVVVLGPVLPAVRPFRAGGLCLLLASTLALAAGTFGLGPGATRTHWRPSVFMDRGGLLGDAEHWLTSTLVGTVGTHIVAAFGLLAAITLLTGASLASVLRSGALVAADTTQELRARGAARRERVVEEGEPQPAAAEDEGPRPAKPRSRAKAAPAAEEPSRVEPPTFDADVRVGRGPVELDGSLRYPDLWHGDARPLDAGDRDDAPAFDPVEEAPLPEPVAEEPFEHESHNFAPAEVVEAEVPIRERPVLPQEPIVPRKSPEELAAEFEQGALDLEGATDWHLPTARQMLKFSAPEDSRPDTAGQAETARRLLEALGHFGVDAQVVGTVAGPHITRYELRLAPGIKMSKVAQMKDDLAYALAATDIRILAPIPGKQAVGVEVPNAKRRMVTLGDVMGPAPEGSSPLTVWLGKDVSGKAIPADLAKMPHILVAGTTGAGKSGCINAMLSSILLRATPDEVRLILVDPKQVELNHYEAVPHLLTPVITSPRAAANALQNLVKEMEWRYGIMSMARTRSLPELNRHRVGKGEAPLPYVLCVIDELADLMMVAPADVEDSIIRIAQKARAVGIHLVLATQSPRVDVITGMIKANVPSRIAFSVSSQTDSRVILDQNGAESLLGMGDMLFSAVGSSKLHRIQGAYIDEGQIAQLTEFWAGQGEPDLREDLLAEVESEDTSKKDADDGGFDPDEDPLLGEAIELVVEMGTASTSMLQRRLRLGYTRAGRLMDMLERRGVISGYEGSKPRSVLVTAMDLPRVLAALAGGDPAQVESEPLELPSAPELPDEDAVLRREHGSDG